MRTPDFGSVEVHTVVRDSQVGLSVGSEKGDLKGFLAPEVPSLQAAIHQQDLRFDSLRFLDHATAANAGFAGNPDSHSQRQNQPQPASPVIAMAGLTSDEAVTDVINSEATTRLSVLA